MSLRALDKRGCLRFCAGEKVKLGCEIVECGAGVTLSSSISGGHG